MGSQTDSFGVSENRAITIASQEAEEKALILGGGIAPGFAG